MATKKKGWIAKATANSHGQFRAKAKAAGMTTAAYAAKETKPGAKVDAKTKRQANLAKILMRLGKKRKKG